jgi:hypothetical protein
VGEAGDGGEEVLGGRHSITPKTAPRATASKNTPKSPPQRFMNSPTISASTVERLVVGHGEATGAALLRTNRSYRDRRAI